MATLKTILVRVDADTTGLQRSLGSASTTVGRFGQKLTRTGTTLTRNVTVPLALAGGASVKMAADFDRAFTQMNTLAGVSRAEVAGLKREVLELSGETAKAPEDLAKSLYFIRSSGFEGAAALDVLTASAKASAAGLGDTVTVADAVTSAMNAYGPATLKASAATDVLIGAVRSGKGEASEIGQVIGRVIPLAAELGVTFQDVGAATASMTLAGLDASEATTALRGIFTSLLKPTVDGEAALKKMGTSVDELRSNLAEDGLLNTLLDLKDRIGDNKEALADIFPNVRALAGFLNLTGARADDNARIFDKLAGAVGETDKAFDKMRKSRSFKFDQVLNDLRIAAIRLGNKLIPVLVDEIIPAIESAIEWWGNLDPATKGLTLKLLGLAAVAGPLLRLAGALVSVVSGIKGLVAAGGAKAIATGASSAAAAAAGGTSAGAATGAAAGTAGALAGGAAAAKLGGGFAAAFVGGTALLTALDPLGIVSDDLADSFERGTVSLGKFSSQTVAGKGPVDALGRSLRETETPAETAARKVLALEQDLISMTGKGVKPATAELVAGAIAGGRFEAAIGIVRRQVRNAEKDVARNAKSIDHVGERMADSAQKANQLGGAIQDIPKKVEPKVQAKDQASAVIRSVDGKLNALDGKVVNVTVRIGVQGAQNLPGGFYGADGGIVGMASGGFAGMVGGRRGPHVRVAGEGSYATPYGKGAEWVQPLNNRGIGILSDAMRRAGVKDKDGGQRFSGTLMIHPDGRATIEGWAVEAIEKNPDAVDRSLGRAMGRRRA